jgi:hypothetical protein
MKTLQLEKSDAIKIYPSAPEELKKILICTFGKECFSGNIIDRIKTFEDALEAADEEDRKSYEMSIVGMDSPDELAYKQLKLIAKVLRGNWLPDWSNSGEGKWWPFFKFSSGSGFDFSLSSYHYDNTFTSVSSRLCFPTEELSSYFGRQFIEIHRNFLTII